jgi:hypothetical protein
MRTFAASCFAILLAAAPLSAQSFTTSPCESDSGGSTGWFGSSERACEVRRATLPLADGQLKVSGKNGGIEVIGEERQDIALEVRITARGSDRDDAQSLVRQVKIVTSGTIHAEGPESWLPSRRSWQVDFKLHVPRKLSDAQLHTENGGISLTNIEGAIHAETTNGGLTLDDLAGDVHATTVNGGMNVKLAGHQWSGTGLVAKSTNGGVTVKAADNYSAHLIAETVNGGVSVGFPITIKGTLNRNHIDTNIGDGGATLEFQTVNGGVSIHAD